VSGSYISRIERDLVKIQPMVLRLAEALDVSVDSAGDDGVVVWSAGIDGVAVGSAGDDGVEVSSVGVPSVHYSSSYKNGFEIAGAQGYGLFVGRADLDGVYITSTAWHGLNVIGAGVNGVYVTANNNGVDANTTKTNGEWGLYTPDKIRGSNVTLSSVTMVAQVAGEHALALGDVVAAVGVGDPLPGSTIPLALVGLADTTIARGIVGVVEGRMALTPEPQHEGEQQQELVLDLRSAEGPAQPGDYVAVTVLGVAQVKVQDGEAIQSGQRLTVSATPGQARALQSKIIEGMMVTEGAPVIGAALEAAKDGLVWVLVNPQ
jgi:hypothetical protein